MPRPTLSTNKAVGIQLKNKSRHCTVVLPGQNLSTSIRKRHVEVHHPRTNTDLDVQSGKAVQTATGDWFLIVRIRDVPHTRFDGSEEIEVTVTNPDPGGGTSDPETPVEVVYFDEEPTRGTRRGSRPSRVKGKTARSVARGTQPAAKSKGTKPKAMRKKKK